MMMATITHHAGMSAENGENHRNIFTDFYGDIHKIRLSIRMVKAVIKKMCEVRYISRKQT